MLDSNKKKTLLSIGFGSIVSIFLHYGIFATVFSFQKIPSMPHTTMFIACLFGGFSASFMTVKQKLSTRVSAGILSAIPFLVPSYIAVGSLIYNLDVCPKVINLILSSIAVSTASAIFLAMIGSVIAVIVDIDYTEFLKP